MPQQFKSSREEKKEKFASQRPEDFMDDEDRGAFGFAAEALKTKRTFQNSESSAGGSGGGAVAGALMLEQLVQPVQGTVGEALLVRQGWRPGQGIGPKVTRRTRQEARRKYAPRRQEEKEEEEEQDPMLEKYKDFLFAPDEIPVAVAAPKDNFFGIGYSGLVRGTGAPGVHGDSGYRVATSLGGKGGRGGGKKFSIRGEAFGVGADEEEDDSIYDRGGFGEYDFSLDVTGGDKKPKEKRTKESSRWGPQTEATISLNFLEGFHIARKHSQLLKRYPGPPVPEGWVPRQGPTKRKSRFEPAVLEPKAGTHVGSNPSVSQRRAALFPDSANKAPQEVVPQKEEVLEVPEFLLGETKSDGSFKPFARNIEKQKRYEQYQVCLENGRPEVLRSLQPRVMTEWEREREREEFQRASHLFKPMKGEIGSRFVSAGDSETVDKGEGTSATGSENNVERSAKEAAELKMFGALTRTKEEWHPARLLCVRFNVAHPYSDHSVTGVPKPAKRETGVTNVFAGLESEQGAEGGQEVKEEGKEAAKESMAQVKEEEVVVPKPPMDMFKAIFADSDSDESDNEPEEKPVATESEKSGNHIQAKSSIGAPKKPWEEKEGNVLRSKEPATGIFANIDFDALNKRPAAKRPRSPSISPRRVKPEETLKQETASGSSSDDGFGPALPPTLRVQGVARVPEVRVPESITISSGEDDFKKSKKRRKDKKKKHKSEKKKRKVREASIVISSDSEDDWTKEKAEIEAKLSDLKEKRKKGSRKSSKKKKHDRGFDD